ncbi:hypothetical protein SAMN05444920_10557 [Nonomuraea solani]|uniref:Uncharacterized protein n=1 Tax=Nonomuraea solani TaxID=1144553 RepID=A0A1H6DCW2_9ACTN|nr:hypothetical protein [Nonomuraea solani]SEG82545.1 hypothetical protein SAMN05444920_10557 [Nonomuraea solani]
MSSSDELKVPSQQRNDVAEGDDDKARLEESETVRAEEFPGKDRGQDTDDEIARSDLADGTRDDEEKDYDKGYVRADDDVVVATAHSPRVDDEYVTPVSGDSPDPAHRDPYAKTGGDMLAEPEEAVPAAHAAPDDIVLFDQDPTEVQARWRDLQASFVDDPGQAVERADGLVGEVVESLTNTLTTRTNTLRDSWKGAENSDTEQLRLALRDYRSVLERLLALSSKSPTQYQSQGTR